MNKLKIGVIGLGNMGRHHVRQLANIETCELIAICDNNLEKVNEYSQQYNCQGFTKIDNFIKSGIEAVSIVVPTSLHYEICQKFLNNSIHTLIEKPITKHEDEGEKLIELAKQKNCTLMVGHIEQFNPAYLKFLEILKTGELGNPLTLISRRIGPQPKQIKDTGVIIDLAVHDIGMQIQIMNSLPNKTTCLNSKVNLKEREDRAEFFLEFNNASGYIQVNWLTETPSRTLSVTCSKGTAEINLGTKTTQISIQNKKTKEYDLSENDALKLELESFINSVQNKTKPEISGEDGLNTLKIALNSLNVKN